MSKIVNRKSITIITAILYAIAMLAFELLYCNSANLANFMQGQGMQYHFAFCRIVVYMVFFIVYFIYKDRLIDEAIKVSENRYKRMMIYLALFVTAVTIGLSLYIVFRKMIYIRAMSIALITVLMGTVFIIYVSNDLMKNIVVTVLTIGMVFSISTRFNHALDEKKHFMSALNIAFFHFDYANQPITDLEIEKLPQLSKFNTIDEFLKNKYTSQISEEVNMEDVPSTPATYNVLMYIVPAFGILVAKTLGGSIIDLYIMGRMFNLILYAILIGIAVKLLPYKKNIFMVIAFMPMALLLAASYSIDGICIGIVFIFTAYCLKLRNEKEELNLKDLFILIGMLGILLLAKSMAYIMVAFIVFLLPIIPTLKKNKKYLPIITIVFVIACVLLLTLALYIKNTKVVSDVRATGNINVSEQLDYVLHHPIFDVRLLIIHIKNTLLSFNWIAMLNQDILFTKNGFNIMLILMFFIGYVALTEDDYNFKVKDKIILGMSFLLTFFMTSMILYLCFSEVGGLIINGYQTRYIFPILPLLLFCVSNNKVKSVNSVNRNMNISIISSAFIMIGLIQSIVV